jgi:transcriptional regulator GlxA family with amidase domain
MNFGILVFPGVEELDFVGPWEILGMWSRHAGGPEGRFIVAEFLSPVVCFGGLSVNPHVSFENCPPLDYLLVPGGQGTRKEVDNPSVISFIARQAGNCKAVLSVCTGSFLLHGAGLLSGRKATTHWNSLDRLRELKDVDVIEERVVKDGTIWTSAGVSAGIDLMLAFIEDVAGEKTAGGVQFGVEYYPSSRIYAGMDENPKAPGYLKRKT